MKVEYVLFCQQNTVQVVRYAVCGTKENNQTGELMREHASGNRNSANTSL